MHSLIYQISTEPISKAEYIGTDHIEAGEMTTIDYAYDIDTAKRKALIKELAGRILPKGIREFGIKNSEKSW